jgi:hypothetical protein
MINIGMPVSRRLARCSHILDNDRNFQYQLIAYRYYKPAGILNGQLHMLK